MGEIGVDEGAVSQELFSIAARTLCRPSTGAFRHFSSGLVWFPTQVRQPCGGGWGPTHGKRQSWLSGVLVPNQASSFEDEDTFLLIGTLCGMALFNQRMVPFPFPRALYKKLLDLAPTLEDLEDLLPTVGRYEPGMA